MIFTVCKPADVEDVLDRVPDMPRMPVENIEAVCRSTSFSGWHEDVCVGCAGLYEIWPGRAAIWALLPEESGRHMVRITRFVKEILDCYPARRIEATVVFGHWKGERWMKMLGFQFEGHLHAYAPDGKDHLLFARIKRA